MSSAGLYPVSQPLNFFHRLSQVCIASGFLSVMAAFNRFNDSKGDDYIGHIGFVLIAIGMNPVYPFYPITEDMPRSVILGLIPFWLITLCFVGSYLLPGWDIPLLEDYGGAVAIVYAGISFLMIFFTTYRNDENFTEEGLRR